MQRRACLSRLACLALSLAASSALRAQAHVEVNTASRAQLESLPGLGPALVQRLLDGRPFSDWADLLRRVRGLRAASAKRLSDAGLRVAGRAWPEAPAAPASAARGETG
ncbi:MAG: hypothetical protein DI603_16865 [Roseateles depolymerans]|uniref:Helix-hairpin-helix domain-containing protein n=1 Tax=Roseateles depolymerans TaxID=76731 RepID=A0A2W5DHT0_9BURK|nr:MAG: hypothetical protein DI603_16865 [Roseateles depolymerans]